MIDPVVEMLRHQFNVDESRSMDYRHNSNASSPYYQSVHLVIRQSDEQRKYDEEGFKELVAEVQVRTVLQHGWAEISHISAYKVDIESAKALQPMLAEAAALLEKADQIFSDIGKAEEATREKIRERVDAGDLSSSVGALSIPAYIRRSASVKEIAEVAKSEDFETSDNVRQEAIEQLVVLAEIADLRTLEALDKAIQSLAPKSRSFFHSFQKRRRYRSMGTPVHWTTVLLVASRRDLFEHAALQKSLGWDDDFKTDVLAAANESGM